MVIEMEQKIKPVNTIKKLLSGIPVVIAALGDSLTYGWMVNKGYLDFLGEMIDERFSGCQVQPDKLRKACRYRAGWTAPVAERCLML